MTLRLGINGFGRIGRNILRALLETGRKDLQVVAINDPAPLETLAHLFEFDSLLGRFSGGVTTGAGTLDPGGTGPIAVSHETDPAQLSWPQVDVALECSGHFTDSEAARRHLSNGARRVLVSAPVSGPGATDVPMIVYGINHARITAGDLLVSNGSCTTNCLAPVAQILDAAFGISHGMMTTVHCYTGNQPTQDAPHPDLNRGRAAGLSMIPTSTGAAEALGAVLPALAGRITGHAIRVPVPNVSCVDLSVEVEGKVTVGAVNEAFEIAAAGPLSGILATTRCKLVSTDFARDPHSAILATDQTRVQQGRMVRVLAWYDNEWGFSNRMLDTATAMGRMLRH